MVLQVLAVLVDLVVQAPTVLVVLVDHLVRAVLVDLVVLLVQDLVQL